MVLPIVALLIASSKLLFFLLFLNTFACKHVSVSSRRVSAFQECLGGVGIEGLAVEEMRIRYFQQLVHISDLMDHPELQRLLGVEPPLPVTARVSRHPI